jgi:hypothetical protein
LLPYEFQDKSTSDQAKGKNEQLVTIDGFILVRSSNLTDLKESCNIVVHANGEFPGYSNKYYVQPTRNEGRLEFAENPQMKPDEDPLQDNMNTVQLEGKKVLVRPPQAESTNGKKVIIGEERPPRMNKPKNPEIGRWKKNERSKPPLTSSSLSTETARLASGVMRTRPSVFPNWTIRFPWIRPILLRKEARPTTNPGHRRGEIQKVGVVINRSIIRHLTS